MKTKHKDDCKMAFGRKDKSCPRCIELLNGATPRKGWGKSPAEKAQEYATFLTRLKNHNCKISKCGPVCVAFDW